jgi:hypothetical protein
VGHPLKVAKFFVRPGEIAAKLEGYNPLEQRRRCRGARAVVAPDQGCPAFDFIKYSTYTAADMFE